MIYSVFALVLCIIVLWPAQQVHAETAVDANGKAVQEEPVRILLVGNSLTRCQINSEGRTIKSHLKKMANASGKPVVIKTVAYGGASLRNYAGMNPAKKRHAKRFRKALKSNEWDYVILQELTVFHYKDSEEKMYPAVKKLLKQIKKQVPDAEVMLYVPRGYDEIEKEDYDKLEAMEMECQMGAAGDRISEKFDISLIQVGMQFYRCNIQYPHIRMMDADKKHPTKAGYFLAASCIYQKIFGEKPEISPSMLEHASLKKEEAEQLIGLWGEGIQSQTVEVTMAAGDTHVMKVTGAASQSVPGEVRFTSLDETVATVDDVTGEITAVGSGMTVVVAETIDGWQSYCSVYVPYAVPAGLHVESEVSTRADGQGLVSVKLTWEKKENTGYAVYRAKSENGSYKLLGTVRKGSFVDTTATLGKTWYYKIAAVNGYAVCASEKTKAVSVSLR